MNYLMQDTRFHLNLALELYISYNKLLSGTYIEKNLLLIRMANYV